MGYLAVQNERLARSAAFSWVTAMLQPSLVEPSVGAAAIEPISWQDVHRRDTSRLMQFQNSRQDTWGQRRTFAIVPETPLGVPELGWVRQNATLVYLLRTGQWQPVPSSPPDCWVERLVAQFSKTTMTAARKILTIALAAVPHPGRAAFPAPLSPDEHEWILRNSTTVHDLYSGRLRGVPTSPSRAWVAAFQSAVGGTTVEISAMLAIIVSVIGQPGSIMIAAD